MKKPTKNQIAYWIGLGHSVDDARQIVSQIQRSRSPRCPEYWVARGYTENEAVNAVSEYQSRTSKIRNKKYTAEERREHSPRSVAYWVKKGHTKEEAAEIVSKNSARGWSEDHLKKKFGEEQGAALFKQRSEDRKAKYTLAGYIARHGTEQGTSLWNRKFKSRCNSEAATRFLQPLCNWLVGYKIYAAFTDAGEYGVNDPATGRYYYYDFVVPELGLCIEFNGDYWHANPAIYKSDDVIPRANRTAQEIWDYDAKKLLAIRNLRGFCTYVVWETDDHATKTTQLIGVINGLKENQNR